MKFNLESAIKTDFIFASAFNFNTHIINLACILSIQKYHMETQPIRQVNNIRLYNIGNSFQIST